MDRKGLVEECLKKFKSLEDDYLHTAVIIAGDKDSQVVLSTWTTLPLTSKNPTVDPPANEREAWDWLWTSVQINWAMFAERTGMNTALVQKVFEPLRANRLVYPDGSAADHALGILKAEVVKAVKAATKKAAPKT